MDTSKNRISKREIPQTTIEIREIKHKCKCCGKEFSDPFLKRICKECHLKLKKASHKCTQRDFCKEKWLAKIGPVEVMMPTKEKWNEDYFQAITTEICVQCGQNHKKGEKYYHTFKQYIKVLGLPIHEIKELLEEYKDEFKRKRTVTEKFLEDRGLEIKEI